MKWTAEQRQALLTAQIQLQSVYMSLPVSADCERLEDAMEAVDELLAIPELS